MKKLISCIVLLGLTLNAWSYNERGNSGHSIICDDPSQNMFYDFYEAQVRYGLKTVFPEVRNFECTDEINCLTAASVIARKFLRRLPKGALLDFALLRLANFNMEVNIQDNVDLGQVNDIGISIKPKNCEIKQTIIQRAPRFSEEMRYIINNDYWKQISTKQKAIGLVHEVLYGYYDDLKLKPSSSERIRYLNALIISDTIKSYTGRKFDNLLEQVYSNE